MAPCKHGIGAALAASALVAVAAAEEPLRVVNLYRSLKKKPDVSKAMSIENTNLADVIGVLRYLHQEVVPEHAQADPNRLARKYEIDSIAKYEMHIRNPEGLTPSGVPGFGPDSAFDFGAATTSTLWGEVVKKGDYVGASLQFSAQIKFPHPWYWFAFIGPCPNLPYGCIVPFPGCPAKDRDVIPSHCLENGCSGKPPSWDSESAGTCTGKKTFWDPTDPANKKLVSSCCLRYKADPETMVKGGRCNETETVPTGKDGCVYQYEPPTEEGYVSLDVLAGITTMPCGTKPEERNCTGWEDWRKNCYDPEGTYKKKFQCEKNDCANDESPQIVATDHCVEYDIHPFCQDTSELCDNPKCQKLLPDEKEVGLPFWKGKCDPLSNQRRGEAVATHFLGETVAGKHLLYDPAILSQNPLCEDCIPNYDGGPYCTRTWAGLCSRCYIPGTATAFADAKATAVCPWGILKEPGVKLAERTACASTKAEDLCCLYLQKIGQSKCDTSDTTAAAMPLDVGGFLTIASREDGTEMETWMRRYLKEHKAVIKDETSFMDDVYWAWAAAPPVSPTETPSAKQAAAFFDNYVLQLHSSPGIDWPQAETETLTTTVTTTVTTSTTETYTTTTTVVAGSSNRTLKYLGVGVVLVASFAGIIFLALQYCREQAHNPPVEGEPGNQQVPQTELTEM